MVDGEAEAELLWLLLVGGAETVLSDSCSDESDPEKVVLRDDCCFD